MRTTSTPEWTEKRAKSENASPVKSEAFIVSQSLVFIGTVLLALACWIMLVFTYASALKAPAIASGAIVFFASIIHLIQSSKTNQKS